MSKRLIGLVALAVALTSVKTAQAQYPKIPPAVQAKADSALDEAKKRSDIAWAKALPIIEAAKSTASPIFHGLINHRICHRLKFRLSRVLKAAVCIPKVAVVAGCL
jgi:hypothetical protein